MPASCAAWLATRGQSTQAAGSCAPSCRLRDFSLLNSGIYLKEMQVFNRLSLRRTALYPELRGEIEESIARLETYGRASAAPVECLGGPYEEIYIFYLVLCFPLQKFDTPWHTMASLSIIRPPGKHQRMKKTLAEHFPAAQDDSFFAWALSLAILAVGVVLIRLLF